MFLQCGKYVLGLAKFVSEVGMLSSLLFAKGIGVQVG